MTRNTTFGGNKQRSVDTDTTPADAERYFGVLILVATALYPKLVGYLVG